MNLKRRSVLLGGLALCTSTFGKNVQSLSPKVGEVATYRVTNEIAHTELPNQVWTLQSDGDIEITQNGILVQTIGRSADWDVMVIHQVGSEHLHIYRFPYPVIKLKDGEEVAGEYLLTLAETDEVLGSTEVVLTGRQTGSQFIYTYKSDDAVSSQQEHAYRKESKLPVKVNTERREGGLLTYHQRMVRV